jgi:hypothetical protein
MVIESYEWFRAHHDEVGDERAGAGRSHHQSSVRMGALKLLRRL